MTSEKTPAEIEIEKLEKELKSLKEIYDIARLVPLHDDFVPSVNAILEYEILEAKLSGLKQGIELGRKESEDNHNWIDEKECFMDGFDKGVESVKQQLSNKEKEIIEKIEKIMGEEAKDADERMESYSFRVLKRIKQIEGKR